MPNILAKVLILVMGGFYIYWIWLTTDRRIKSTPEYRDMAGITFMAGAVLILCLTINALAFVQSTYVNWMTMAQQEVWDVNGHYVGTRATRFQLYVDQINLFIGTGYMMGMIRDAAALKEISPVLNSKSTGLAALDNMLRRLVFHHWWLIAGMLVFFGLSSGTGMMLFLAIELTIVWGGVRIGAMILRKREQRGQ